MRHKASQVGDYDAITAQKQNFDVSVQFNHVCKGTVIF